MCAHGPTAQYPEPLALRVCPRPPLDTFDSCGFGVALIISGARGQVPSTHDGIHTTAAFAVTGHQRQVERYIVRSQGTCCTYSSRTGKDRSIADTFTLSPLSRRYLAIPTYLPTTLLYAMHASCTPFLLSLSVLHSHCRCSTTHHFLFVTSYCSSRPLWSNLFRSLSLIRYVPLSLSLHRRTPFSCCLCASLLLLSVL